MTTDSHQRIARRQSLTPRQEEVLALIGQGCTNGEIAERLDITLDGAKWHVSEIIAKLGVDSREEAVEAWRAEQSLGRRLVRLARALLAPVLVHKVVAASVAGAAILVAGGAIVLTTHGAGGTPAIEAAPLRDLPRSPTWGQVVDHPVFIGYQMFDSKVGWAQANDGNAIILTEDGGLTWKNVSPNVAGNETLVSRAVAFIDGNHAAVIASPPIIETAPRSAGAHVYWTADRGNTWHESDAPITWEGGLFTFADPQHGWIETATMTAPVVMYRTADSGRTWQTVYTKQSTIDADPPGSLPRACPINNLRLVSDSRGFVWGGVAVTAPPALPCFFRTDDGGATWQRVLLPDALVGQYTAARLSFPTPTDGFFTFGGPNSASLPLYATHDSGVTWVLAARVVPTDPLSALQFVDALHGWAIGPSTWLRTVDGGKTLEPLTPNPTMPSAEFVSPDEGFGWPAFGHTFSSDATVPGLYHTLDGGKTWQPVLP